VFVEPLMVVVAPVFPRNVGNDVVPFVARQSIHQHQFLIFD
jgi:hypothetical protein